MPSFFLTDSTGKTRVIPLAVRAGSSLSLGRSEECDIALPDEVHLSRTHCILTIEKDGKVLIKDVLDENFPVLFNGKNTVRAGEVNLVWECDIAFLGAP